MQMPLFDTRVPTKLKMLDGKERIMPDGIADESDPLYADREPAYREFLKANGLFRQEAANRLEASGGTNLYTNQAAFRFYFDAENNDLSEVMRAWALLKPLLRRWPEQFGYNAARTGYEYKDVICLRVLEPSLSEMFSFRIYFVSGEGWYLRMSNYDTPRFLGAEGEEAKVFEELRRSFGWSRCEALEDDDED
jgi:hypothetical protein